MTTEKQSNSLNSEKKSTRPVRVLKSTVSSMDEVVTRAMMPLSLRPTKSIKKKDSLRPSKKIL